MSQHLFVLGPSGAGKTLVASRAARELGYHHLEIDRFPEGNGIDLEKLREPWDLFYEQADARVLAAALDEQAKQSNKRACTLSFPSGVILSLLHIRAAAESRIRVRYLYSSAANCINSFLTREKSTGRNLGVDHWLLNNASSYLQISCPQFAPYRIEMFGPGRKRLALSQVIRKLRGA